MIITVMMIVAIAAFITAVMEAMSRCPSWVPAVILSVFALLQCIPLK